MRRGGMGCAGRPWAQGRGSYPGATHPPAMLTSRQPCGLPRTLSVVHVHMQARAAPLRYKQRRRLVVTRRLQHCSGRSGVQGAPRLLPSAARGLAGRRRAQKRKTWEMWC